MRTIADLSGSFARLARVEIRKGEKHAYENTSARSFLEKALALDSEVVALTIDDRERILWALDDVRTEALAELRGVLLQEHEWRTKEGLV